jgi:hypothetical protein
LKPDSTVPNLQYAAVPRPYHIRTVPDRTVLYRATTLELDYTRHPYYILKLFPQNILGSVSLYQYNSVYKVLLPFFPVIFAKIKEKKSVVEVKLLISKNPKKGYTGLIQENMCCRFDEVVQVVCERPGAI